MFLKTYKELKSVSSKTTELTRGRGYDTGLFAGQNISTFWRQFGYAFRLIAEEKEIVFCAMLQWLVIGLAYVMWTQVLDWIPDDLWNAVRDSNDNNRDGAFTLVNLVLLAWSFLVVVVASYPLSLLNAAMVAAHYLHHSGQASTLAKCLRLAGANLGQLWIFTTIDAWITVTAILDRLPRKRGRRTLADEALYYAWKIGTIGITPALVAGKGFKHAALDSIKIIRQEPVRAIGTRMGYSLLCWIIGVTSYVGAFYYFKAVGGAGGEANRIYNAYFIFAVPILIAVGATTVLLRPFYLVMVSRLYSDVISPSIDTEMPESRGLDWLAFVFGILLCVLVAMYLLGDQLGIRTWIEALSAKDLTNYRNLLAPGG